MKNLLKGLLIAILSISSLTNIAQESDNDVNPRMPQEGDFGVSILIDGLIDNIQLNSFKTELGQNLLFGKYYLKNDMALRLGFGLTLNSASRETADSVGITLVKTDSSASNYLLNFSGGIEKHFNPTSRLDPYVFTQLDITFIGKTKAEINSSTESSAGVARTERTIKQDGGVAFSLSGGGGFNYFLAQRFSVGMELAFRLTYASEGGTITDNTVNTPINGSASTNFISREDKINVTQINTATNALINLSYFF